MNERFLYLRIEMNRRNITGTIMADYLGISQGAFSARICGKVPFSVKECYLILDYLKIPADRFTEIFPKWEVLA